MVDCLETHEQVQDEALCVFSPAVCGLWTHQNADSHTADYRDDVG
jgi:hypothetical protein